jgi:hypothetical protein
MTIQRRTGLPHYARNDRSESIKNRNSLADQPLTHRLCLTRVDLIGKATRRAEREPEECELIRRGQRTIGQKLLRDGDHGFITKTLT